MTKEKQNAYFEFRDRTAEMIGIPTALLSKDIIPLIAKFAVERDLDFIQLIDADVLASNAAYDEQTRMEVLTDRQQECRGYSKSLMIIDLDSLVGVSMSNSISNMGPSLSYSFVNQNLFSWACDTMNRSEILPNAGIERWTFVIVSNEFAKDSFRTMIKFPLTAEEKKQKITEKQESSVSVRCARCSKLFLRSDNKFGECKLHLDKPNKFLSKKEAQEYTHPCCSIAFDPQNNNGCWIGEHIYDPYMVFSEDSRAQEVFGSKF